MDLNNFEDYIELCKEAEAGVSQGMGLMTQVLKISWNAGI